MIREEAQQAWGKIVEVGFSDYEKLTREQRIWFNVEPLVTDGLWDHYMNYGADKNADTIADLEYLGFDSVSKQFNAFNKKYFPNGVPKGPDVRQDELESFSEDQLEKDIEELDENFWEISDDLESALLDHINRTGIGQ